MPTIDDLWAKLSSIESLVVGLQDKVRITPAQITIVEGLSDISNALGLVEAGEFRSGNREQPGESFSGVRIVYPPVNYGGSLYNIAGVDADTLMVGIRSSDGTLVAGAGNVELDVRGMSLKNNLGQVTMESASDSGLGWFLTINTVNDVFFSNGIGEAANFRISSVSTGSSFIARMNNSTSSLPAILTLREDPALDDKSQLDLSLGEAGAKYTMGGEVEIHAQGSTGGQTFALFLQSSDTPSTSNPSLDASEIRMYYRLGKIVFQVFSTGDTDEDVYFYATLGTTGVSSDWTLSTDAQ